MQAEADRLVQRHAGEPWFPAAQAALAAEEAGTYSTPEDAAAMWNAMVPLYFAHWDERYRCAVEVERLDPEPLRQFNATPFDLRPQLGRIDADTLVITGREDFICGPAAAEVLVEGIRGARLVVVEDAGHMLFLEQPQVFVDAVETFLAS
jgi:proline iminopeptidase